MEPFVIGSLWGNLSDNNEATLVSSGATFRIEDRLEDVWGEVSAGVSLFNQPPTRVCLPRQTSPLAPMSAASAARPACVSAGRATALPFPTRHKAQAQAPALLHEARATKGRA